MNFYAPHAAESANPSIPAPKYITSESGSVTGGPNCQGAAITISATLHPVGDAQRQPRAVGHARVASKSRGQASVLGDLYQAGASKVVLPRSRPGALDAVLLNTAGGITGGDRFDITASAGAGSTLTMTTQAAERIYRAQPDEVARVSTRIEVAHGARLNWLPQETILFDGSALRRRLTADLTGDASLLLVEPLVFGRALMGERLTSAQFHDRYEIRRDGALVFADAIRLTGDIHAQMALRHTGNGAGAMASLLFASPDAERFLDPLRRALPEPNDAAVGGVSLIRDGVLFLRLLAPDSYGLRRRLIPAMERLLNGPIPRTWTI
ncbi:MAG: urease accessory protein [Pseudooceanicola sp.]|nr:urease accessory protein [Pseudooceanicola sp.]